jgi:dihydrofolate synthase/folylpolyglutamate synthase
MREGKAGAFLMRLDGLNEFKFDFSLSRVKKALSLSGNPQDSFQCVHVAGSNGKGSVTAYLSNIFIAHGFRTGTYTSPHFTDVRERMLIDGKKPTEKVFAGEGLALFSLLERNKLKLTYFEFLTVLAFIIFRRGKVRAAVVEAGLGGRFDATNIDYKQKLMSIITSISLEHTEILGKTVMKILKEKEEIIGNGMAVVNMDQKPLKIHMRKKFGERVFFAGDDFRLQSVRPGKKGLEIRFRQGEYTTSMIEPVQASNIATVLEAVKVLRNCGFVFSEAKIKKAISRTYLPGRMSWNSKGYYLSVAHNPEAFREALNALAAVYPGRNITYVFSALKDKDIDSMFRIAAAYKGIKFILTGINNPRAISIGKLKETVVKYGIKFEVVADNRAALKRAMEIRGRGVVVVGGSFYLVNKFI